LFTANFKHVLASTLCATVTHGEYRRQLHDNLLALMEFSRQTYCRRVSRAFNPVSPISAAAPATPSFAELEADENDAVQFCAGASADFGGDKTEPQFTSRLPARPLNW